MEKQKSINLPTKINVKNAKAKIQRINFDCYTSKLMEEKHKVNIN